MKHKIRVDRDEMSIIRWTRGFTLKERKKNAELRELVD